MVTLTTNGISISVETFYQQDHSRPDLRKFFHAYRITIENNNDFPVQLLSRYWVISNTLGSKREVQGKGVVGEQPIIAPSRMYQYVSGCPLDTEIGKMKGHYIMKNENDGTIFQAKVPDFLLVYPYLLN